MKKAFIAIALVIGFAAISAATVSWAASTGTVNATVTVQNISIGSITDGSVAYGTLALSGIKTTTSTDLNDTQTATNNGNVAVDLTIKGSTTSPANWDLGASNGSSIYVHKFCTSTCSSLSNFTAMNTSTYTNMKSNLTTTTATQTFDLYIQTPSAVSDYTQQSMTVTVLASLH